MEFELKASISEPGNFWCLLVQLCSLDNRIMRPSGKSDSDNVSMDKDVSLHIDELAKDGCRTAMFESSELLRQDMIEGMGNHGCQYIKVYLDQDGRGKGVKAEEFYGFGDPIFNSPPMGIAKDDGVCRVINVVGYEKRRALPASTLHHDLPELTVIAIELHHGLEN